MKIGYLHIGPPRHGVHRYGYLLAREASQRHDLTVIEVSVCLEATQQKNRQLLMEAAQKLSEADIVHFQFTKFGDQLWGEGWLAWRHLRTFFEYCSSPIVVTLHDVYYQPYKLATVLSAVKARLRRNASSLPSPSAGLTGNPKTSKDDFTSNYGPQPQRSRLAKGLNFTRVIIKGILGPEAMALREIATRASQVIVCTEEESRRIRDRIHSRKLQVIPHFVETRSISTTSHQARKELNLEGVKVITLLGFIYPPKGHELLVEAMVNLPEEAMVIFAGGASSSPNEEFVQALQILAKDLGVDHRLRITGYLSEEAMEQYLVATDIAVCPFVRVSASGSLSTWISVACPVLASESPQIEELSHLEPGAVATFRPYTPVALAEAISKRVQEPQAPNRLAMERLRQKLLIPNILKQHTDLYRSVINSRGREGTHE
ncbi:MAG: glycosyltransferase family 4 protein [Cyanobacteria bacterium P01_F01_bin.86]